jgi:drug/metabolite transporter (DMT)-like permease
MWFLRERVSWYIASGILASLVGVYFIVSIQTASYLAPKPALGNFLTLGAAISAGIYNSLCRRLTQTYSPWTITFYQSIVATIIFLPLAITESVLFESFYVDAKIVFSILYLAIGSSIGAYFILNYTLSKLPTYQVAIFANFIPVVTVFASWIIFGDILQPLQILGASLILMGIFLTYARLRN